MRLPRRVPWSSLAELEQLCASIYADELDLDSKIFAINRVCIPSLVLKKVLRYMAFYTDICLESHNAIAASP